MQIAISQTQECRTPHGHHHQSVRLAGAVKPVRDVAGAFSRCGQKRLSFALHASSGGTRNFQLFSWRNGGLCPAARVRQAFNISNRYWNPSPMPSVVAILSAELPM
jgi:hypothetical protein